MKNFKTLFIALMALVIVSFNSCNKEPNVGPHQTHSQKMAARASVDSIASYGNWKIVHSVSSDTTHQLPSNGTPFIIDTTLSTLSANQDGTVQIGTASAKNSYSIDTNYIATSFGSIHFVFNPSPNQTNDMYIKTYTIDSMDVTQISSGTYVNTVIYTLSTR